MQTFLQSILSLTVGGSVLALAVLGLSRVNKLPKSFIYGAWVLVLLRLAIPLPGALDLKVPEAPGVLVTSETGYPRAVFPADAAWDEAIWNENLPVETTPVRPYLDVKETPDPIRPKYMNPKTMNSWEALGILWILGFIFCMVRDLGSYIRLRRAVKKSVLPPLPSDLENYKPGRRGPRLLRCPGIDSPMLMGIFRPVLLLPDRDYEPQVLRCIFVHELTHFRRGDIWLKWLAMPILAAHWFNPLMILVRREFHRSCELSCDERILKSMDHDQRKCYGETLLFMAQPGQPVRTALSTSFCAEKRNLKERLVHIMNFGPKSKQVLVLTALLVVGILAACLALGPAQSEEPTQEAPARIEIKDGTYLSLGISGPIVYTGENVRVQVQLEGSDDLWGDSYGLLLLLDGRPQPYWTAENSQMQYMHTFSKRGDTELIFEPVTGHDGAMVDLGIFTVKNPDQHTADPTDGDNHSNGTLELLCKVDMRAEPLDTAVPTVTSLAKEVQISMVNSADEGYKFRFTPGARLNGKQRFQAKFSGPEGAELSYVIYLNNEPVAWEHFADIKDAQTVTIDTLLNLENFRGDGMIYAVLYGKNFGNPRDHFIEVSDTYYLTVTGADQAIPGASVQTNAVLVSNVDEFLEAIGPDTHIVLEPGTYDLTTAKTYGKQQVSDYYRWDEVRDGYGLTIRNVDNLFILGSDAADCEIVTQPRYAPVVRFAKCTGVTIRNLTAGHTEGVEGCSAAVFQMWGGIGFEVRNCDLYGCGTYGVEADNCERITVRKSTIRDCSYGAAHFISCVDVFLTSNKIQRIGKSDVVPTALFQFDTSSTCAVLDCQMSDSVARKLLLTDNSQQIYLLGSTGQDLDLQDAVFASRGSAPTVDGCQLKFVNQPKWIDENYGNGYVYSAQGEEMSADDLDEMKYRDYPSAVPQIRKGLPTPKDKQARLDRAVTLWEQLENEDP